MEGVGLIHLLTKIFSGQFHSKTRGYSGRLGGGPPQRDPPGENGRLTGLFRMSMHRFFALTVRDKKKERKGHTQR